MKRDIQLSQIGAEKTKRCIRPFASGIRIVGHRTSEKGSVKTSVSGREKRQIHTLPCLSGRFDGGNQRQQGYPAHDKISDWQRLWGGSYGRALENEAAAVRPFHKARYPWRAINAWIYPQSLKVQGRGMGTTKRGFPTPHICRRNIRKRGDHIRKPQAF